MLAQTSFAISHDETRYAVNGIVFVLQGKDVQMVETDGHRLAVSKRSLGRGVGGMTGIVPRKPVIEIMRVLGAGEDVQVAITENQFVLQMPNFVMTARLIEGQFPNYEAVVPKAHPGRLVVSRPAFAAAVRRVAGMAEERNKPAKVSLGPARSEEHTSELQSQSKLLCRLLLEKKNEYVQISTDYSPSSTSAHRS